MHSIPKNSADLHTLHSVKFSALPPTKNLHQQAFDNSLQAEIILNAATGKIIEVNHAACELLGYSKKELLTKNRNDIFDINEVRFKEMLQKRSDDGKASALVTAIASNGSLLSCDLVSALFTDDQGTEQAITTITDTSDSVQKQKKIDLKKEKKVSDDIIRAKADCGERVEEAKQEVRKEERMDLGNELHDNVGQLLGASRMYQIMAKDGVENRELLLQRSSEYTLNAIEEIRKLSKGLTMEKVKNFHLGEAIKRVSRDMMEISPVTINTEMKSFMESTFNVKAKMNIFRIVQEQIHNILKHAAATDVVISLLQNDEGLTLTVKDNGVGFDTGTRRKGIGLANIKRRAERNKGLAEFVSQPGEGCTLTVTFPVA